MQRGRHILEYRVLLRFFYEKYVFDFVLKQLPYCRNLCVNEDAKVRWGCVTRS